MGLVAVDLPTDTHCASGPFSSKSTPSAIHLVLSREEVLKREYALYQGSGGQTSSLLSITPTGAITKVVFTPQNPLAMAVGEICSAFAITKDQLAQVCKVQSRKTLYNWINGETEPRKAAMSRIFDLLMVARAWRSSGFNFDPSLIHQPILNGSSVFDLLNKEKISQDEILFAGSRLSILGQQETSLTDPFA